MFHTHNQLFAQLIPQLKGNYKKLYKVTKQKNSKSINREMTINSRNKERNWRHINQKHQSYSKIVL